MCGLVFVKRLDGKPANRAVLKRYNAQKMRGSDGFGYISLSNSKINQYKRSASENIILKSLGKDPNTDILFHHRLPTSTPNLMEAAHPIKVSHKKLQHDYYVVHNGIITNADELKETHEKDKVKYTTEIVKKWVTSSTVYREECFNDSEALAVDLAFKIENGADKLDAQGSIAFICYQVDKKTKTALNIFFGRNSANPLKSYRSKDLWTLTSEGDGVMIDTDKLFKYCYANGGVTARDLKIPTTVYYGYGYGYPYSNEDDFIYGDAPVGSRAMGFNTDQQVAIIEAGDSSNNEYRRTHDGILVPNETNTGRMSAEDEEAMDDVIDDMIDEYYSLADEEIFLKEKLDNAILVGDLDLEIETQGKLQEISDRKNKLEKKLQDIEIKTC